MKKRLLGLALLAGLSFVSRKASAETPVDGPALKTFLTEAELTTVDVTMTSIDLSYAVKHTWAPGPYAAIEFVVGGLQFAVCLDNASSAPTTYRGILASPRAWDVGALIGAIFFAHSIVTIVAPRSHTEAPPPPPPVTVTPLALSDVARTSVPGLAVLGRF